MKEFYSNGKLFISGEYVVLDGGLAFALPTRFGQYLTVEDNSSLRLEWNSFDYENKEWFFATYNRMLFTEQEKGNAIITTNDTDKANTLLEILLQAKRMNPDFLTSGAKVKTELTFPRNWGLGTSSTLINSVADWAGVDPFQLLWNSFKGSGYDIACARNNTAITYRIHEGNPVVKPQYFQPEFIKNIYFVYLNQKQDSKKGIAHYKQMGGEKLELVNRISAISTAMLKATTLQEFETLIYRHEDLIATYLHLNKVKDLYFSDYWGAVKSLGAWGGDFVMATGNEKTPGYFKNKGFDTVLRYDEMILA